MNPQDSELTMHDQHLLDLLVDGELDDAQRRELVAGLDHTPDGWRRCALAFLEAQSWGREMQAVVREPAQNTASTTAQPVIGQRAQASRNVRAVYLPLALAASLLVAFMLGLAVRPSANGGANDRLDSTNAAFVAAHDTDGSGLAEPGDRPLPDDKENDGLRTGRWGTVKLVIDTGPDGGPREVELPAVESDSWDESLLTSAPAMISPELKKVFERLGHQVRQERELVSFELDDGRQMIVPVDTVQFTPAANRVYQ